MPADRQKQPPRTGGAAPAPEAPPWGPLASSPARRLRVLIVTPKAFLGGAEHWLLSLLDNTERLDPTVVVLDAGPLEEQLRDRGVRVVRRPTGKGPVELAATSLALYRVIKEQDPDVLLASGIKAATLALPVARQVGVPSVWVEHEPSYTSTLSVVARQLADRTITVTPPSGDAVVRSGTVFVPPPLLAEPEPRESAVARLRRAGVPDDGRHRLGMFCRLAPYKGIDTALRALAMEETSNWRLIVAGVTDPGAPEELERLTSLAEELDVMERVSWLGEVPAAGRLAAAFDAIAVLTRTGEPRWPDGEGYGMALVEGHAAGVPVVADPRAVPALRDPFVASACLGVDATDPSQVALALAETVGPRRTELGRTALNAGTRHPRPVEVAERVVAELARVSSRPGAGIMRGPRMSIVVTVLNEQAGVDEMVRRLLGQCRDDDELVVVDGGSSDGTYETLLGWARTDQRVRVLSEPGTNISAGRNRGILASTAEWIACTDCGCEVEPAWLDALRVAAAEDRYDLVTGVYRAGEGEGRSWENALAVVAYPRPEELRRQTPLVRAYGRLFGRTYDATLPTGRSVAFRRDLALSIGGFPEHLATAEDVMFGQAAVRVGARCVLALDAEVLWEQRPTLTANGRMFRGYGRGDGQSGNTLLIGRNLARAATFALVPFMGRSRPMAGVALVALTAYLSLPLKRALSSPRPVRTAALVPVVAAYRDMQKALGCAEGLSATWRGRRSSP